VVAYDSEDSDDLVVLRLLMKGHLILLGTIDLICAADLF
jgi:hypothetical protein